MKFIRKYLKYFVAAALAFITITQWDSLEKVILESLFETKKETPRKIEPNKPRPSDNTTTNNKPPKTPGTITIVSWNMCNLGGSKSYKEVEFAADLLNDYDVIAIQEVATRREGADAIGHLHSELNRRGSKWDYILSDPTSGAGTERYAYIWKSKSIKLSGRPWLVKAQNLDDLFDREPYMARFVVNNKNEILIANFHAIPSAKKPENEIGLLYKLHNLYKEDNLILMGDFNLHHTHDSFKSLKAKGYRYAFENAKTTLRRTVKDGDYMANPYDNFFYEVPVLKKTKGGIIDFVPQFSNLKAAREVSDHLPIWIEVGWK